jgi:hypothetical protein
VEAWSGVCGASQVDLKIARDRIPPSDTLSVDGLAMLAAAAEVLLNSELMSLIILKPDWRARSVCQAWRRYYDGDESRPAPDSRVQSLREGSWCAGSLR